jgi:branched-chain amino acid aminotransferase
VFDEGLPITQEQRDLLMSRLVYLNGEFVPEADAKISIFDSALMFGDMVFEMTRSFNGKQFKLREHLERLYASIRYVRIPLEMTIDEMEEKCHETIEKNQPFFEDHDEHRLMINVSRGPLSIYHRFLIRVKSAQLLLSRTFP